MIPTDLLSSIGAKNNYAKYLGTVRFNTDSNANFTSFNDIYVNKFRDIFIEKN